MRLPLLCLSLLLAAPAWAAEPPPQPSFDCKAARSTAERLICADATLARMDAQAARVYTQARQKASDPEALKKEQLAWLRERDAECIAGAPFDAVRKDARVATCMAASYASRVQALRDRVAPPLLPSALVNVTSAAREKLGLTRKGCDAMQGAFDDSGKVLAVEVNCEQAGQGRRVWLVEAGERTMAATPELGSSDPHGERIRTTGTDFYWDGDTLYVFTVQETQLKQPSASGEDADWLAARFTATMRNGSTRIEKVPERVEMFFGERIGAFFGSDEGRFMNGIDGAITDGALNLGRRDVPTGKRDPAGTQHFSLFNTRLVWIGNPEGDIYTLNTQSMDPRGPRVELARGGSELLRLAFDNWHVIYSTPLGLQVHDLAQGTTQRIAGTTAGDLPLAWAPQTGTLAWASPRPCGGAKEAKGGQFICIAHVDGVRMP